MEGNGRTPHDNEKLTERQKREKSYYDRYIKQLSIEKVSFDPVVGDERRPWNSYWYVYEITRELFRKGRRKLLDFGCGWGETSLRFAKIGYTVHGFDISEGNLETARILSEKYNLQQKIDYTIQAAEALNYPPGYFDVIVGFDILHHVDVDKAVKECKRVMKKDGIAIFREPVEAPIFDKLRNTKLVKYFVPKDINFTPGRHITEDERKLNDDDFEIIKEIFNDMTVRRFTLFSRLDLFLRKYYTRGSSPLEVADHYLFKMIPWLRKFGGEAVIILKK